MAITWGVVPEVIGVIGVTRPNNRVERTAAMRFGFDGDGLQTAVIAVVSALPAAVAHPVSLA